MATRLYFPSSGTPPLASLARDANWELPTGNSDPALARLPTFTAKQNTALATSTLIWPATATQQWLWWQFQSEPLLNAVSFLTSHTISMVLGLCGEAATGTDAHLAFSLRVVSGDGATVRGTLLLFHAISTEYTLITAPSTRIHSARPFTSAIDAQIGDRLILEIGVHGVTPTATNVQHRIGDPSAVADFALTAGLTTDLCSWWEISPNVAFGVPAVGAEVSWAEVEVPNAPRAAEVSWAEVETPNAPRQAEVSWAEVEVPEVSGVKAEVSWAEVEIPNAPRQAEISWAEVEIPGAPRAAEVSWSELEVPTAPRAAEVSWGELEVPNAPPTYTSYGGPFLWTAANWGSVSVYLEVYVRATAGTVYARLFGSDNNPVASSEVNTNQATFQRLRSAAVTLVEGRTYRVQFGKSVVDAGEFLSARLVIIPA